MKRCEHCNGELVGKRPQARYCSERCRKDAYEARHAGTCVDCGTVLKAVRNERCFPCSAAARKEWTPERICEAIRWWADEHGRPPSMPDFSPYSARYLNDPDRADHSQELIDAGQIPHAQTVVRTFGSWSAGIVAAGFEPRAQHGGAGNNRLQRSHQRVRAVADDIVRDYLAGNGSLVIGRRYGITHSTVLRLLHDRGVQVRPRTGAEKAAA